MIRIEINGEPAIDLKAARAILDDLGDSVSLRRLQAFAGQGRLKTVVTARDSIGRATGRWTTETWVREFAAQERQSGRPARNAR